MTVPGLSGQYADMPRDYGQYSGDQYHPEHARGWLTFAGIMLGIVGVLNVVYGIASISDSKVFEKSPHYIVMSSIHAWGWIFIGLGVLQLFAAASIMRGGTFGSVIGITVASFNMLGSLFSIRQYPFWSMTVIFIDLLIIYGLAVYGGRGSRTTTG